jgi:hypothetical protein
VSLEVVATLTPSAVPPSLHLPKFLIKRGIFLFSEREEEKGVFFIFSEERGGVVVRTESTRRRAEGDEVPGERVVTKG